MKLFCLSIAICLIPLAGCAGYTKQPSLEALPAPLAQLAGGASGKTFSLSVTDQRKAEEGPCVLTPWVKEELTATVRQLGLVAAEGAAADYVFSAQVLKCNEPASTGEEASAIARALVTGFTLYIVPTIVTPHAGLDLTIHHQGKLIYQHRSSSESTKMIGWVAFPYWLADQTGVSPEQRIAQSLVRRHLLELDEQGGL